MSTFTEQVLAELQELRRLGLVSDSVYNRACAVARREADEWEAMRASEAADMAVDLARMQAHAP